jgi:dephospho-CoA kinase
MIENEYEKLVSNSVNKIVFLEAALLIEANWHKVCGQVWVVTLDTAESMKRLKERDGLSKADARSRIDSQLAPEERLAYADVVLKNDGLPKDLVFQTQLALQQLKQVKTGGSLAKKNN